jgi:hypothetical protein
LLVMSLAYSHFVFRHMKASNWPRNRWPSACSRRLESEEWGDTSILARFNWAIWAGWGMA